MEHGSNLPQVESNYRSLVQSCNLDDNWAHVEWVLTTTARLTHDSRTTNGFHRMTRFSPDGTAYRLEGAAHLPPVVLCHGVGLDLHMWEAQVNALLGRFHILRYDMLGHGETSAQPGVTGISAFSQQLVSLLKYLEMGPVSLVGFSMGGVTAQHFALQHPTLLRQLVLMNTVYRRTADELAGVRARLELTEKEGLTPIADAAVRRWFEPSFVEKNPQIIATIRRRLLSNDVGGYLTAYRIFVNADDEIGDGLNQVTCPTLVLTGELDPGSTPQIAQRMITDLKNGQLIVFDNLRHMAPVEDPDRINTALLSFLK
jgi:pimeloyl-ACP methyl ester carboxylesterase